MSKDIDLWDRYFNDFVLHKLRLDSEDSSSGIAQQILHTFLGQLHQLESLERVVGLHSYLHVYQLDLAKMASVLRPLNKLQKVCCLYVKLLFLSFTAHVCKTTCYLLWYMQPDHFQCLLFLTLMVNCHIYLSLYAPA